jgi:hypothetical protein
VPRLRSSASQQLSLFYRDSSFAPLFVCPGLKADERQQDADAHGKYRGENDETLGHCRAAQKRAVTLHCAVLGRWLLFSCTDNNPRSAARFRCALIDCEQMQIVSQAVV